jgi:hypothetical protein
VQSGLPDSTRISYAGYPIYLYGRGDMGRLPTYKMVDLNIQHELRLGGRKRLQLQANIDNPFDLAGYTSYYTTLLYRSSITPPNAKAVFFGGPWDIKEIVAERRAAGLTILDQDFYRLLEGRQGRRTVRFNMRFSF